MKVRAWVTAAAIAAGLCWSPATRAQEAPPLVDVIDAARFLSAPRALGDAWERAVRAALDGVRAFLEADLAARHALAAALPPKRAPPWTTALPARREVREARRVVRLQPATVEPVAQAVLDARGQRATLLGAVVELPWTLP